MFNQLNNKNSDNKISESPKMKRFVTIMFALTFVFALTSKASAVDFQEELKKLAQDNAVGYVGPFATAFGTAMNSGLYHTAKPHAFLGFDVSAKISLVQVADEDLTFDFIVPGRIGIPEDNFRPGSNDTLWLNGNNIWTDRETSTMFGADTSRTLIASGAESELEAAMRANGFSEAEIGLARSRPEWDQAIDNIPAITTPPGLGIDMVPLVMPQASLGLPFKTEVLVRFVPETDLGDFGKVKMFGWGVKHSISQWIPVPMFGIDLTGQYAMQNLELGPITSKNTAFNLEVSRRFGFMVASLTPYAGFGIESSDITVDYTVVDPGNAFDGTNVKFDLEGNNTSRLTAGARLQLLIFTINADINMGEYTAYSVGVGVTLR